MKADGKLGYGHLVAASLAIALWPAAGSAAESVAKPTHDHSQHPICRELDVTLDVVAVGKPETLVLLRSDFRRRGMGLFDGHGVKFYVNGKRAKVDVDVTGAAYEWLLDMMRWPAATYYVAVNVCDHHDHIGVATLYLEPGRLRQEAALGHELLSRFWGRAGDFVVDGAYVACCGEDGMWPDRANATSSIEVTE